MIFWGEGEVPLCVDDVTVGLGDGMFQTSHRLLMQTAGCIGYRLVSICNKF